MGYPPAPLALPSGLRKFTGWGRPSPRPAPRRSDHPPRRRPAGGPDPPPGKNLQVRSARSSYFRLWRGSERLHRRAGRARKGRRRAATTPWSELSLCPAMRKPAPCRPRRTDSFLCNMDVGGGAGFRRSTSVHAVHARLGRAPGGLAVRPADWRSCRAAPRPSPAGSRTSSPARRYRAVVSVPLPAPCAMSIQIRRGQRKGYLVNHPTGL
jgi:hypothetical protein